MLAIGNELRGDDGLGPLFAKKLSQNTNDSSNVVVIDGGTVPENFTGSLRNEKPTHVILIDAVEMNGNPGDIEFIEKERISQFNVSTHAMPISFLIKYLETTSSFKIILIGIQPKKMVLGEEVTLEVENSLNDLVNIFKKSFKDYDLI